MTNEARKVVTTLPVTEETTTADGRWRLLTVLPSGKRVSTVCMSGGNIEFARMLDAALLDDMLGRAKGTYETMVFPADDHLDLDCARYATEGEARKGHAKMIARWLAKEE